MTSWTTSADVETKVRRRWASGALLRAHTLGEPFEAIRVTLRTPAAADLSERLEEIRRWAADLERRSDNGRRFELESKVVGGRTIGRSTLPGRAIVRSYEQAWRLLGVREDVRRFDGVLAATAGRPAVTDWVVAHPLRAVSLAEEWPSILTALEWLDWNAGTGLYLRQVDAPGVDTKFIERHRGVLAALLAVRTSAQGFVTDLGFAAKPPRVRLRFDPDTLRLPAPLTEAELRTDELAELPVEIAQALIVENEVTYLSVPIPPGGVVLYGRGYDASQAASLPWLRSAAARGDVSYWGDIDTHGFQILNRVRSHLPGVRSALMDRDTLLRHEERWGREDSQTNAALPLLTAAENALYADVISDRFGPSLRLEQERIDWAWATQRLPS
ncbi:MULTISPECIES: Wadjet anti-phage system protein JetD domain-containing protein [unclassified Microbacterium]|uniref:Wadjet anti-phage system protein JetD domain-containing protein n=1 Tax=unclassified Microbacterium TaxID=2609290 RepID=UPI00097E897A|nr:Wadjet anti-phage system protein JetD domain-containing protein [Microbacterium sp. JB110]RCS60033.1 hypothetical protein CIK77_11540 [Microbacterium sp. JB110]SJM45120.1 hypothetical protein CZ774_01875 [Frigoribacterium sp. JB110]